VNPSHNLPDKIEVAEQRLPGEPDIGEEEAERRGLPDICLYNQDGWAVAIECKVEAALSISQLKRHRRTLERRGFDQVAVLAVAGKRRAVRLPRTTVLHQWTDLYDWACAQRSKSAWAPRLVEYMETVERKLVEDEYLTDANLTHFSGIPFGPDRPYTYLEGKRLLRLAMHELRAKKVFERTLGADLKGGSRGAITGSMGSDVWDFIPLRVARKGDIFTKSPHMTLSIGWDRLYPLVTIPNGIRSTLRQPVLDLKRDGFRDLVCDIVRRMCDVMRECPGAQPMIRVVQRHSRTQRSKPIQDALIHFDMRTALLPTERRRDRSRVKYQPQWIDAAFGAFSRKASNLQLELGLWMDYDRCPEVRTRKALDLVTAAWLSCKPLLRVMSR
jgi:hypothetical protein